MPVPLVSVHCAMTFCDVPDTDADSVSPVGGFGAPLGAVVTPITLEAVVDSVGTHVVQVAVTS